MVPRTIFGSALLLTFAILLLANCAVSSQAQATLPLTPPPITSPSARLLPRSIQPSATPTATSALTETILLTPTLTPTVTPTVTPPVVVIVEATSPVSATQASASMTPTTTSSGILPTVTPTQPALVLLPTPTPTRTPTVSTSGALSVTPTSEATPNVTVGIAQTPSNDAAPRLPTTTVTQSMPLPPSFRAQGSFASQTVYTDSTIAQQQGTFTIVQSAALNPYGANQHYTLRTQRAVGQLDEINIYQLNDYIVVSYTGDDWMLVRRDQGSNIVRAIQPITDLAILFPRIIAQTEFVGQESVGGISTLRYRVEDPAGQAARLIQPLLALTGEIRSLKLEVWIAVPGGYVAAYNFQVELAGARVLDLEGNETRADQAVTWTYQLTPATDAPQIEWPTNAPRPDAFPVRGFAVGTFPIPPETELLALVSGIPELISALTPTQVDSFYRAELFNLGWRVEGEGALLTCVKNGVTIQLLIAEDAGSGGTRITVLPEE